MPAGAVRRCEVLIIAPHSDDEAIGCTAVTLRAVAAGKRVGVVVVTAGDGFPKAAAALAGKPASELTTRDYLELAALRQRHTLEALPKLGVSPADIHFLGYPDGGLKAIYESSPDRPYRQPLTQKNSTYGVAAPDYHTRRHGKPALYRRQAVVDDLAEIIRAARPDELYVTSEVDTHSDHAALFAYVRDAAAVSGFRRPLFTYVVHGNPPVRAPDVRLTLTDAELARKRATLEIYQAGVSPVHDRLAEEYAKPEEIFWKVRN